MRLRLSVPLDRVRNYLGAHGVALSMSFVVSQVERAADLLEAIDGEHWKELLAGSHLATDGTGFKVQIPQVRLHHGILEVYHWDDRVVFQYEATKHGDAVKSKLAKFEGTLLVDAESRYDQVFGETITEAGCNAHGRRKFRDAETVCWPRRAAGSCRRGSTSRRRPRTPASPERDYAAGGTTASARSSTSSTPGWTRSGPR